MIIILISTKGLLASNALAQMETASCCSVSSQKTRRTTDIVYS